MSLRERFESHIDRQVVKPCWLWTSCTDRAGYGRIKLDGRMQEAARVSVGIFLREVTGEEFVEHECGNRWCVNPCHLRATTAYPNFNREKTHCKNGHEFTPENTYIQTYLHRDKPYAGRVCKICKREAVARYKRRKRKTGATAFSRKRPITP